MSIIQEFLMFIEDMFDAIADGCVFIRNAIRYARKSPLERLIDKKHDEERKERLLKISMELNDFIKRHGNQ